LRPAKLSLGNLNVKRDFTDVRDVVRAYSLLLEKGRTNQIYNVCSGTAVLLADLLNTFQSVSRINPAIETAPERVRLNEMNQICGDPAKLQTETGWKPEIPLEQMVLDLMNYWRVKRCSEPVGARTG
jgi:GDP-4-dehydro-6-deoxy-D-mannose reductase